MGLKQYSCLKGILTAAPVLLYSELVVFSDSKQHNMWNCCHVSYIISLLEDAVIALNF